MYGTATLPVVKKETRKYREYRRSAFPCHNSLFLNMQKKAVTAILHNLYRDR